MEIRTLLPSPLTSIATEPESTITEESTPTQEQLADVNAEEINSSAENEGKSEATDNDKDKDKEINIQSNDLQSHNQQSDDDDCIYVSASHFIDLTANDDDNDEDESEGEVEILESMPKSPSIISVSSAQTIESENSNEAISNQRLTPESPSKISVKSESSKESISNAKNKEIHNDINVIIEVIETSVATETEKSTSLDNQNLESKQPKVLFTTAIKKPLDEPPSVDIGFLENNFDNDLKNDDDKRSNDESIEKVIPIAPKILWSQALPSSMIAKAKISVDIKDQDNNGASESDSSDSSSSKNSKNSNDSSDNSSDSSSTSSSDSEKSDQENKSSESETESGEISDDDDNKHKEKEEVKALPQTGSNDEPDVKKAKMET